MHSWNKLMRNSRRRESITKWLPFSDRWEGCELLVNFIMMMMMMWGSLPLYIHLHLSNFAASRNNIIYPPGLIAHNPLLLPSLSLTAVTHHSNLYSLATDNCSEWNYNSSTTKHSSQSGGGHRIRPSVPQWIAFHSILHPLFQYNRSIHHLRQLPSSMPLPLQIVLFVEPFLTPPPRCLD